MAKKMSAPAAAALILGMTALSPGVTCAQDIPGLDTAGIEQASGLKGQVIAEEKVFKIGKPRTDVKIRVDQWSMAPFMGLGSWAAFTPAHGGAMMMGDTVVFEDEVNPVMSAAFDAGLEVTALHNHFFYESPRLFYMHVMGHGKAADLARMAKPAVDLIGHVPARHTAGAPAVATVQPGKIDTAKIAQIVGHAGEQSGSVYKITVGRDDLSLKETGATINARMGLNTWAGFVGTDEHAAVAGDVAMLEPEVTSVLKALRSHGLEVVAIHNHMIGSQPTIIFLHYWGQGPVDKLAAGFKAALDELGKSGVK